MVQLQRRFTTIMSADVAGYARLMWENSTRAIESLLAWQSDVGRLVAAHGGRVIDFAGDNMLAEFRVQSSALRCACEVQRSLAALNRDQPAKGPLLVRIGLHSGSVLSYGERLFGTTVNLAARLQTAAPIGGLLVSRVVAESAEELDVFVEGTTRIFKNIPCPIETWSASHARFAVE
jgi:adenylate cyclase